MSGKIFGKKSSGAVPTVGSTSAPAEEVKTEEAVAEGTEAAPTAEAEVAKEDKVEAAPAAEVAEPVVAVPEVAKEEPVVVSQWIIAHSDLSEDRADWSILTCRRLPRLLRLLSRRPRLDSASASAST